MRLSRPTRVLLINPPSPVELGAPLLGQQYVAAALLAHGCDVRIVDGAARNAACHAGSIASIARQWQPDVIGIVLVTRWVYHTYALARLLRGLAPWLLAGGPHATLCPEEPLEHGFNAVLTGEVEHSIVQFVDFVAGRGDAGCIPGLILRDARGNIRKGSPSRPIEDLDDIPLPMLAHHLYESQWYSDSSKWVIPGGVITSRGCPSRCTFCANAVTGRQFRTRSTQSVIDELKCLHRLYGISFFPFWDDAFTADPHRLEELCCAFEKELNFPLQWTAIARASQISLPLLHLMKRAGCTAVNLGVESGDDRVLTAIGKEVTTAQVVQALRWAKAEGLMTVCNFMMGFPQESARELENTLSFMRRVEDLVDVFSTQGILVPYPGTSIYDTYHLQYGFTNWWLKEKFNRWPARHDVNSPEYFEREYSEDANLDLDFFHYSAEQRELIQECLRFKAAHNLRKMGLRAFSDACF